MAETKCSSCGHVGEANESWLKCPECGHTICHRCGDQQKKERKNLETIRNGDVYDRVITACPSCNHDMLRLM